jgi:hypothetical protein
MKLGISIALKYVKDRRIATTTGMMIKVKKKIKYGARKIDVLACF